jgi:hypothetical protein
LADLGEIWYGKDSNNAAETFIFVEIGVVKTIHDLSHEELTSCFQHFLSDLDKI